MRRREPLHFGQLAEQRSTLKPPDYFIPESQKPFLPCGLTEALYVAHGLTISESAFERHTNKSGFRNVFPALTWVLAVQKWWGNRDYVRNPT